jgi:hypothetical protein
LAVSYIVILLTSNSCETKVYPDERLSIDPSFLIFFNSIIQKDTIVFENSVGSKKRFVISGIDSIISNTKGWFVNQKPYKLLRARFREIGPDTSRLDRENVIFVNKNPENNITSLCIQFNNLYYSKNSLPQLGQDSQSVGRQAIEYYSFETFLQLKNPRDTKILYISPQKGFLKFETLSGEHWVFR